MAVIAAIFGWVLLTAFTTIGTVALSAAWCPFVITFAAIFFGLFFSPFFILPFCKDEP